MMETILVLAIILIAACLPSLVWLLFFLREEYRPVPARFLIYTFSAGALSSLFVLVSQYSWNTLVIPENAHVILSFLGLALIEETFKFLAAYLSVRKTVVIRNHEDVMILAVTAALGFAAVENIFALAGATETFDLHSLYAVGYVVVVRFIGAVLLHALAAGIIGYHWCRGHFHGKLASQAARGIFYATAVHTAFNYLIVRFQDENLLIYPALFLSVILFFVLTDFDALKKEEALEKRL
jgi:RsiW-degrading membrane proteinase PrsW (M82 family)